jgi:hypothetical protein
LAASGESRERIDFLRTSRASLLRAEAIMAVRFFIMTISMLSSSGSLLLDPALLLEHERDRDLEFALCQDSLGNLDLDLDLDLDQYEDLNLDGLVFPGLEVEGDVFWDEDLLQFLRGLSFARIDWHRLSIFSKPGGSPRVTLVVKDFLTAQRNSSRLWTSLARSSACISSSLVRLPESTSMTARARLAALCVGLPSAILKINGWSQKDWACLQS